MIKVTRAIIPAGGLGTRFLPATKITPKEMLPILDKPAIQYVVEEGVAAGIQHFVIITGKNKNVIEEHFDPSPSLENFLKKKDKQHYLHDINKVIKAADFIYARQKEPLGLGHAVWTARHVIGNNYVGIFLPDDIIVGQIPAMQQLAQVAQQEKCSVVAVQEVPMEHVSRYGVIAVRKQFSPNLFQVRELVEKPSIADAPSNLAIVGRYVLSPKIFEILEEQRIGAGGEIQLTDAIQTLMLSGEKVFAYKVQGQRYDVGNPLGLLKANVDFGLRHPDFAEEVLEYLQKLDRDMLVMQGQAEELRKSRSSV
jgi:UTP--glucose-1-phosphate uridylyltransferase